MANLSNAVQQLIEKRDKLENELELLVEKDQQPEHQLTLIKQLDELDLEIQAGIAAPESKESTVTEKPVITAETLGIEPTVVAPATQEKENNVTDSALVTKEMLFGARENHLPQLSLDTLSAALIKVPDEISDNMMLIGVPGVMKVSPETRIHIQERGEVRRAARGLALALAGGVKDGKITSNDGSIHIVREGVCVEIQSFKQFDSFNGKMALIERERECKGHLGYRKQGDSFVPTGEEFTRCLHQWAIMFSLGYVVSFGLKQANGQPTNYPDVALVEMAQRVGDADAREYAKAQVDEWSGNAAARFEKRKVYSQAMQAERNEKNLADGSYLPDRPEILGYKLPDGRTIQDAIGDLRGSFGVLDFTLPINGEMARASVGFRTPNELASRIAPHLATAKYQGGELKAVALRPQA